MFTLQGVSAAIAMQANFAKRTMTVSDHKMQDVT